MRIFHTHFGRDGGAEKFFVSLVRSLSEAGIEQTALIRPGRAWRNQLPANVEVHEGLPRLLTPLALPPALEVPPARRGAKASRRSGMDAACRRLHAVVRLWPAGRAAG